MSIPSEIVERVLDMPERDRVELAAALLDSLRDPKARSLDDPDLLPKLRPGQTRFMRGGGICAMPRTFWPGFENP
jgi:hypothetical protein